MLLLLLLLLVEAVVVVERDTRPCRKDGREANVAAVRIPVVEARIVVVREIMVKASCCGVLC